MLNEKMHSSGEWCGLQASCMYLHCIEYRKAFEFLEFWGAYINWTNVGYWYAHFWLIIVLWIFYGMNIVTEQLDSLWHPIYAAWCNFLGTIMGTTTRPGSTMVGPQQFQLRWTRLTGVVWRMLWWTTRDRSGIVTWRTEPGERLERLQMSFGSYGSCIHVVDAGFKDIWTSKAALCCVSFHL